MQHSTQPLSGVDSGLPAQRRRILKLSEKLGAKLSLPPEIVFELCQTLDEAVEFAALEGISMAEAIAAFIEDGDVPPTPEWQELGCLAGHGSARIDIAAISLPVIPKQIARLLRTSNDDASAMELERISASDPVFAGKLLGAANSVRFGSGFEVVSLLEAVMRLGIPQARKVLLRTCFAGLFASKPLQDLWKHSETVAAVAYDLALLAGIDAETAYVAGLLHDIGRLAFTKLPAALRMLEQEWLAAGFPVVYAETMAYGVDHATLGAECLRDWALPASIVDAVRCHHRPESTRSPLSAVLTLAEDFTARAADMASEDFWPGMRRTAACLMTGLTLDQIAAFDGEQASPIETCA